MENYVVEKINNDFLSQSYSQSIERITGTKDHIFNFQVPKKILKVREKSWVNLFGKYSRKMSDDIVLNVDTLEPDEEEIEKEVCEDEYTCEQRIPMRKPATLVQYWINTGNQPYKALLDENELSDTGESLSEKEITFSLHSSVSNTINEDIELCSMSKEYISKTSDQPINIVTSDNMIQPNMYSQSEQTDKLNVFSISEKSLDIQSRNDNIQQFNETSEQLTGNGENNTSNQEKNKILEEDISYKEGVSENIIAQEMIRNDTSLTAFYRKKLYTGRNSPIDLLQTEKRSINKLSGAMQNLHPALDFDCTIKRKTSLVHKDKSKTLSPSNKIHFGSKKRKKKRRKRSSISDKIIMNTSNESSNNNSQNSIIDSSFKILLDDTNSNKRNDILLLERNNANTFLKNNTCKDLSSLNMNPIVLLERIAPSFIQHKLKSAKNNHIMQKSNVCNSRHLNESSSYINKLDKLYNRISILSNTSNIENVELETIDSDESTLLVCQCKTASKDSVCSFNLGLSTEDDFSVSNTEEKDDKSSSSKNIDVSQNKEPYTTVLEELSPHLSVNKSINIKSQEIDATEGQLPSSAMELQIFNKDDTIRQKNVLNKSKTLSSNSHGTNKIDNVKSREIKIVLERLPASVNKNSTNTIKTEIMNKNNIQQKEILNKFKTHSSNSYEMNRTDNVKLRELKITLERLSSNICINNTNIFADKNIISNNTDLHNNKRERRIKKISEISCENVETSIRTADKVDNNYLFRSHIKTKKYNDSRISDTSDIVEHQVFNKIESEFSIQYKNDSKMSQSNHSKYSVLTFTSSDEDDFVQLIERPKKKSKFSINDKLLDETNIIAKNLSDEAKPVATNKDKYNCSRNLRTVIFSSKKPKTTRKTFESINEKKGSSEIEIKSFDNTITSLKMCENKKLRFIPNENDNDSLTKNLERKKRASFLNYNKNISNSNEKHLTTVEMERNGIDYKDDSCGIFFQTKTFYSDSSDSEENNTASIRKTLKNSSVHHKLQYHNHANLKEIFNDSKRKHSSSLNSSFEKHEVTNQKDNVEIELGLNNKETKISKRLDNEEFNKINSRIINTKKDTSACFINDISIRDTTQKNMYSSISLVKNNFSNLSENEQIFDKSKNTSAIQGDVKSTKLLNKF